VFAAASGLRRPRSAAAADAAVDDLRRVPVAVSFTAPLPLAADAAFAVLDAFDAFDAFDATPLRTAPAGAFFVAMSNLPSCRRRCHHPSRLVAPAALLQIGLLHCNNPLSIEKSRLLTSRPAQSRSTTPFDH
jgi:hypothetical protein